MIAFLLEWSPSDVGHPRSFGRCHPFLELDNVVAVVAVVDGGTDNPVFGSSICALFQEETTDVVNRQEFRFDLPKIRTHPDLKSHPLRVN